jgi:protein-tyrosine phosphatase
MENMNYIDIHTHILPEVDDGSSSMDETVRMLKKALEQGIKTIIATPHYMAGGKNKSVGELTLIRERVQAEAEKLDKEFSILLGNELYYSDSVIPALKNKEALTLAGSRYVLVEFSPNDIYDRIFRGMGELVRAGYAPVLAHVERYQCLYKREDLVNDLIELGCYIQMNSNSLIGGIFNTEVNQNKKLLYQGMVHLIGSDCHDEKVRIPIMETAVKALRKKCDESFIERIFYINPRKILENTYI